MFPSVTTALQLLRERRTPLALVTGKGPFTTKMSLAHFGLDGVFDPVEVGSPAGRGQGRRHRAGRRALGRGRAAT